MQHNQRLLPSGTTDICEVFSTMNDCYCNSNIKLEVILTTLYLRTILTFFDSVFNGSQALHVSYVSGNLCGSLGSKILPTLRQE